MIAHVKVTSKMFHDEFAREGFHFHEDLSRAGLYSNFSDEGLDELFSYYEEQEAIGHDVVFDVSRFNDEWKEFDSASLRAEYGDMLLADCKKPSYYKALNDYEFSSLLAKWLREYTTVLEVEKHTNVFENNNRWLVNEFV